MRRGFVYLVAIVDWATRRVLAHRVSISMSTDFCVEALEEAIARYGRPEIFNTDQGSQFTSAEFTGVLKANDIRISMDGKGRWIDKAYVSHCTSFVRSKTTLRPGRLNESLVPCALRGGSSPGGSYRHSFLSL